MRKQKNSLMYLVIMVCASGLYIAGAGLANCLGLFYKSLASAIGGGIGDVSLCITMSSVITGFAAKLMPTVLKRFPFKGIVAAGTLMLAGGIVASSHAASVPVLAICFIVKGLGGCLIGMTSINFLVDNWFSKGSGTVLGIAMSMSGIVAAILSPCFSSIIENRGWQFAIIIFAVVSVLFCLPVFGAAVTPEKKSMQPYGGEDNKGPASAETQDRPEKPLVKDFTYYTIIMVMFLITAAFCMVSHIATYASSIGLAPTTGALLLSTIMISNMAFKLVMGFLCDKIDPLRTSIISFSFVTLAFLLFIAGTRVSWLNFAAAVLFGAVFFCSTLAVGQIIKMLYDREMFSRIYASALMISSIASAVFGTLTGYSYDWFGTYLPALCVYFTLSFSAVVLLITLNRRQKSA
ncbi:MAG: MFS transporter [Lawsonibacter sp.]|nr:MFS transporter [Lawsonibacter sp.]